MAEEVATVFGAWLPALSQQNGTTKKPREQGQNDGQPSKRPRQARRGQRGNGQRIQADNLNNVVSILAALSLQQEDALNRVRLDSSHTFHLEQAGPGAILKALCEAGRSWHEKKGQGVPLPALRTVVFALLVSETKARLALFAQDPNAVKAAVETQMMNPNKQFVLQRWNPKDQKLEQDPNRNPLGVEQIQQLLQELGTYCKDNISTKFNSVRKMKREPEENEKAVFVIEIALRSQEAHRAQSTGVAVSASQLHSVEPCGSANAPTIPEETRPSGGPPKGPGSRVGGSSWGANRDRRPVLQGLSRDLARMKMRNTSNTCYLNSTVFSILWQVSQRVDVRIPDAWHRAMTGRDWNPVNFLRFQLVGWRQPHVQHDVAEFIQFLMPKLGWLGDGFSWGARIQVEGQIEEFIHSGSVTILIMATQDGLCSPDVQHFISPWHAQAHTHALHRAPQHIYIQLPRYRETSNGIVKQTIPLNLNNRGILLPVFTSPLHVDVSWKRYDVITAITHLGPTQNTGHYRVAAFMHEYATCWYSNDNQAAESMSTIPAEVQEQCYILGCLAR